MIRKLSKYWTKEKKIQFVYKFKKQICTLLAALIAFVALPGFAADPGSSDDPLISLSYVNDVLIPQLQSYIDTKLQDTSASAGNSATSGSSIFNIVNVSAGQTVIGGKSCRMIVRMGTGTVVASAKGGIADVTVGNDLTTGVTAPPNHLLIVPVDDWRGIKMETDGIIMISGTYSVNQ